MLLWADCGHGVGTTRAVQAGRGTGVRAFGSRLVRKVVEASELIAADLFRSADENRYRITFGDVEKYLAQLAQHPRDCTCGRCGLAGLANAQRVYHICSGWQRQIRATRVRARRKSASAGPP
jgi:hypothetical protein